MRRNYEEIMKICKEFLRIVNLKISKISNVTGLSKVSRFS